ncbi:MAG: pilus assembly protein CpaE [Alphaproteobacteria bacterium]
MSLAEQIPDATPRKNVRSPVLAFICDEATLEAVARVVPGGRRGVEVCEGGIETAIRVLGPERSPDLLILDISETSSPVEDINAVREQIDRSTTIIAIGEQNDVTLYRALTGAGVNDYLVKPVTSADLRRALLTASNETRPETSESPRGRVVVVVGTRGGVGASTIAVNIAWLSANEHDARTVLVDLDLHFGTAALALDLEPGHGLRDALCNPDRIDGLFVASALVHDGENLFVLGGEEPIEEHVPLRADALSFLMAELQQGFETVVVDMPRNVLSGDPSMLAGAHAVAIVTDLSLAGLRDAVRIRNTVRKAAPEAQIQFIVNRAGLHRRAEMSEADFERNLEDKIAYIVPEDAKAAANAAGGKPLAEANKHGKAAGMLRDIASGLRGAAPKKKGKLGLLGGLMQKKPK